MLNWNSIITFAKNGSPPPSKRVEKSIEEWKEVLTPEQFYVTRQKGTERPHTGELCGIYESGKYSCVCCDTELFDSSIKFDSGTGWPSFAEPIAENRIKYELDNSYGQRIETLCNTCDAHLGHVFPDGPPPTGIRFCINSAALKLNL